MELLSKGKTIPVLTSILQGADEPFLDVVVHLLQTTRTINNKEGDKLIA